ncbi:MAG TPA: UDP-N-acetylmuramate dehydrogenase [Burkholderiaceae bacterium]|nr:UDP-N-acetylmuramate dehydrogenase [Burkholderiaceae bacterium]
MILESNVQLKAYNTFHIDASAHQLIRIANDDDVQQLLHAPELRQQKKFILGGGSNIVIQGDIEALVLKMEIKGIALIKETDKHWIIESGAGELWHDLVTWTVQHGHAGLENMALIPGTVGAAPVQNIGAYGLELQDRFWELDAVNLSTGDSCTMNAAQCEFAYRDSIFKKNAGKESKQWLITKVRFALPKAWRPMLGYADIEKKLHAHCHQYGLEAAKYTPTALQIYEWVCDIRRHKLPDPTVIGNAGSFFKNPVVSAAQCHAILQREPHAVHYKLDDGKFKLAAGWLVEACGWKGKNRGQAAVYDKQALVLVNLGGASGEEIMSLSKAIQTSVLERFGVCLEPEPVLV